MIHSKSYIFLIAVILVLFSACKKLNELTNPESYKISPTWALPLANGKLTFADIARLKPSQVDSLPFASDDFIYEVIYSDTLDLFSVIDFGSSSFIPKGASYCPEIQKTYLAMFGSIAGGSFEILDPKVLLHFTNEIEIDFNLSFDTLFTSKKLTKQTFPFRLKNKYHRINKGTKVSPTDSYLLITNDSTISDSSASYGALTEVFEPTPKYFYYLPRLTALDSASNLSGTEIGLTTEVHLPLKGRGYFEYTDTLKYNLSDTDNLSALLDNLDFAILRMGFKNTLPISAEIVEINIVDTTNNYAKLGVVNIKNISGDPNFNRWLIPSGDKKRGSSPSEVIREVGFYRNNPITGKDDINNIKLGNALLISFRLQSQNYNSDIGLGKNSVTIYGSQFLRTSIGVRAKADLSIDELSTFQSLK